MPDGQACLQEKPLEDPLDQVLRDPVGHLLFYPHSFSFGPGNITTAGFIHLFGSEVFELIEWMNFSCSNSKYLKKRIESFRKRRKRNSKKNNGKKPTRLLESGDLLSEFLDVPFSIPRLDDRDGGGRNFQASGIAEFRSRFYKSAGYLLFGAK